MTIPGVQNFSYPVTMPVTNNFTSTWTFPSVPTGLTWTGAFLPCVPSTIAQGAPATQYFQQTNWVLYRNGQPEISWTGNSMLEHFQATSGDVITIAASFLPLLPLPNNVQLTWKGWSAPSGSVPPDVPSLASCAGNAYDNLLGGTNNFDVEFTMASGGALSGTLYTATQDTLIYGVTLSASLYNSGAAGGGVGTFRVLTEDVHGAFVVIASLACSLPSGVTGAASSFNMFYPLEYAGTLPLGSKLTYDTGAYPGTWAANVFGIFNANVIYNPLLGF